MSCLVSFLVPLNTLPQINTLHREEKQPGFDLIYIAWILILFSFTIIPFTLYFKKFITELLHICIQIHQKTRLLPSPLLPQGMGGSGRVFVILKFEVYKTSSCLRVIGLFYTWHGILQFLAHGFKRKEHNTYSWNKSYNFKQKDSYSLMTSMY